jgi:hypothetical protein
MLSRIILAAFCLGIVFAADEADARSRSSGHGHSRPAASPRSLQRFQQRPAVNRTTQGLHVTRHPHRRAFHHHHFRHRWPFVFAAPYGTGDGVVVPPTSYAGSGGVPPGEPVVLNGRPCFVQPYIVPAEGTGTMRTVTVTRCY